MTLAIIEPSGHFISPFWVNTCQTDERFPTLLCSDTARTTRANRDQGCAKLQHLIEAGKKRSDPVD